MFKLKRKLVLVLALTGTMMINTFAQSSPIYLDGKELKGADAISKRNTTYIPIGTLTRELGFDVKWERPRVIISDGEKETVFAADDYNAIINDKVYFVPEQPFIMKDRVFVPLRTVTELFGYKVDFDMTYKTINITTEGGNTAQVNQNIKWKVSPDKKWGIYTIPNSYDDGRFISTYIKDMETEKSRRINITKGYDFNAWTPDNRLIYTERIKNNGEDEYSIYIYNPNKDLIDEKLSVTGCSYDDKNNVLYYWDGYYIQHDLNTGDKKEISEKEYFELEYDGPNYR